MKSHHIASVNRIGLGHGSLFSHLVV